jgi:uncharacterized protein YndB with AHSA1/START domain
VSARGSFWRTVLFAATPARVYAALTTPEGLRGWWTTDCDVATTVGGESTFRFGETFARMRIDALEPGRAVRWTCSAQRHVVPGLERTDEWVGTHVSFSLAPRADGGTELAFVHDGLTRRLACYEICQDAWTHYLTVSLKRYVEEGRGAPYGTPGSQ